ncbi:MAG: citrate synthase [Firmicutes bacterium GWF2_51_9]|nr:MAG: citrate synthase [Firmicutes bacterium GWF2_51_9]OGS59400.1 MAG: citrate synthase [Firmicutes bacterium GWE2_51_13]HBZ40357.1 citrate synthase [Erysipelotrichaceae bacterium]
MVKKRLDDKIHALAQRIKENGRIDPELYEFHNVKRGLRNANGTGVLVGITKVGAVIGYEKIDGVKVPCEGRLYYRGINLFDIVKGFQSEKRTGFEETVYLLLFGVLPNEEELEDFRQMLEECRTLPRGYKEDVILKIPAPNIMNKLQRTVLTLYSYDKNPDDISVDNVLRQSIDLIAKLPLMAAYSYASKRHYFDHESLIIHTPKPGVGTAENFLYLIRPDGKYTQKEVELLDLLMVLMAEHGGGNNSSFATHVVSSTGTDTYSAIATAIGSLKGPKHGGANRVVAEMVDDIKKNVTDYGDEEQLRNYLKLIMEKKTFDKKGLIYGLGHAVYTLSDPRAIILKDKAKELAETAGNMKEFRLIAAIERVGCELLNAKVKNDNKMAANVDLYAGFVLDTLGIPEELYTPLFAISRIAGWSAHRLEQILDEKIMRPAYVTLGDETPYIPLHER